MRAAARGAVSAATRASRPAARRAAGAMPRAGPAKTVLVPVADGSEEMEVRRRGRGCLWRAVVAVKGAAATG